MAPLLASTYQPTGYLMIEQIEIRNLKCFEYLRAADCKRINVIVGDNAAGKTALLEAIFAALVSGAEIFARILALRGIPGAFSGPPRRVTDAIFNDFFHKQNLG